MLDLLEFGDLSSSPCQCLSLYMLITISRHSSRFIDVIFLFAMLIYLQLSLQPEASQLLSKKNCFKKNSQDFIRTLRPLLYTSFLLLNQCNHTHNAITDIFLYYHK